MSKKPNGRFLLTWNEKKDPEISEFFNNIEEGMYSHTLREVIKFYMNYKKGNKPFVTENNTSKETRYNNKQIDNKDDNAEYIDISADDI